ncbi:hypothetical protein Val02_34670 [Virgisporangium aliadipatigenens]|uniref:Uncharacterized protein n=1 Tax=Virgisporangium aliadipatigenens TaxID=741659 RepID=A0A8J3YMI9_9ACTN|nr:hypothetical protein [Virgisporangium aliadipatigenens]GIJ46581.1 hypothetical protein Val02_34670 [Virgisporangium aliadipatigenens]
MSDDRPALIDLLRLEYERLQSSNDKYDDQRFKIKGWAITVAGALFALGANTKAPALPLAGAFLVLLFAYLEVMFMRLQTVIVARSNEVESLLESLRRNGPGPEHDAYVFGIGKVFMIPFSVRMIPKLVRNRQHISVFYAWLTAAMFAGTLVVALMK